MAGPASPPVRDETAFDSVSGEDRDLAARTITIEDEVFGLARFLSEAAASIVGDRDLEVRERWRHEAFGRARDLFVRAGLAAVQSRGSDDAWVQFGIQHTDAPGPLRDLHGRLGLLVRRLLSDAVVGNFFFMNKPPGLRIRFEVRRASVASLSDLIGVEVADWSAGGLVEGTTSEIYEPESHLFGGPASMPLVHALFTQDSLLWLDYHASGSSEATTGTPAWLLSLAVVHALFDGLGIEGWEDVGVWDRVRGTTGRRLASESQVLPGYQEAADGIRDVWSRRDSLVELLDPALQRGATESLASVRTLARAWRSDYFNASEAYIGPRTAAAFWVVFHWNRGRLSVAQQALMAEALAARMG